MGLEIGTVVAAGILLGLPLAAVWVAGQWRDPPRERWALTPRPEQEALSAPGLAEYRIRRGHGIRDEARWTAVRRAVDRGEAAPADLRPAAREWAEAVLAGPELRKADDPVRRTYWLAPALALVAIAGTAVFLRPSMAVVYGAYWLGALAYGNPWRLRARRARAEAALAANADPLIPATGQGHCPPVTGQTRGSKSRCGLSRTYVAVARPLRADPAGEDEPADGRRARLPQ